MMYANIPVPKDHTNNCSYVFLLFLVGFNWLDIGFNRR